MSATHYDSVSSARAHLKELLDAADEGRPASIMRAGTRSVVVDARRWVAVLQEGRSAHTRVVHEDGTWAAMLPGTPLAGEGESFDDALDDLICAMRDYSDDWTDRLHRASNHAEHWRLVQLIDLSDDTELRDWLLAS